MRVCQHLLFIFCCCLNFKGTSHFAIFFFFFKVNRLEESLELLEQGTEETHWSLQGSWWGTKSEC